MGCSSPSWGALLLPRRASSTVLLPSACSVSACCLSTPPVALFLGLVVPRLLLHGGSIGRRAACRALSPFPMCLEQPQTPRSSAGSQKCPGGSCSDQSTRCAAVLSGREDDLLIEMLAASPGSGPDPTALRHGHGPRVPVPRASSRARAPCPAPGRGSSTAPWRGSSG